MKVKKKKSNNKHRIKLEVIEHKDWNEWCRFLDVNRRQQEQVNINEDDPLVEAVFEFIEEEKVVNGREPIPVAGTREFANSLPHFHYGELYEGLDEFLKQKEFNKKQRSKVTIPVLNAAWRMYRKYYPPKQRAELAVGSGGLHGDTPLDKGDAPVLVKGKRRIKLWGINISDVIRAMGKDGLDFDEVKHVLTYFNIEVQDSTIRGQIWCGKQRGKYGAIPKFADWQQKEIEKALSSS